jgi:hypothetical protein
MSQPEINEHVVKIITTLAEIYRHQGDDFMAEMLGDSICVIEEYGKIGGRRHTSYCWKCLFSILQKLKANSEKLKVL